MDQVKRTELYIEIPRYKKTHRVDFLHVLQIGRSTLYAVIEWLPPPLAPGPDYSAASERILHLLPPYIFLPCILHSFFTHP